MRDALNATGRPIFFSMCSWGREWVWEWAMPVGNSWRTTGDIHSSYESFVKILDQQIGLSKYSGPGGWNDPDMLEVGNGLMTHDEYQSHFAFWAALKSPLLIGCGLSGMTKSTLSILGNEEVIAVNQDPLGKQIELVWTERSTTHQRQLWAGPLSNNRMVLLCFNRHIDTTTFKVVLAEVLQNKKVKAIREVIEREDVAVPKDNILTSKGVRGHATAMYVITYEPL